MADTTTKIVIDTSVFTNPVVFRKLGKSSEHAMSRVLAYLQEKGVEVYMTPGCYEELGHFVSLDKVSPKNLVYLRVKTADKDKVEVSGAFIYEMVCDFRLRSDNALKYACVLTKEVYNTAPEKHEKGKAHPVASYITRMRDGFRTHMRTNFIDSGPDMDTLLLTKELGARLATIDLGMVKYAARLGLETLEPTLLLHL